MPRDRNVCDMKGCENRKGRGYCSLVAVWIKPDENGRPVCQSYRALILAKEKTDAKV